jgi:hypothetical protein
VKFGRRKREEPTADAAADDAAADRTDQPADAPDPSDSEGGSPAATPGGGPHDIADVDVEHDGVQRVDLGGILVAPSGLELRLQVDEASGTVQSVLVASDEGAVELRAFAAQRNGDLWSEVRRSIASETSRAGGTATEREGRFGPELSCVVQVRTPDGRTGTQPSRVIGVNGPRWFLRATMLGKPAVEPEAAGPWEDVVAGVVVRRGTAAMAPGDPLPVNLPPTARRVQ